MQDADVYEASLEDYVLKPDASGYLDENQLEGILAELDIAPDSQNWFELVVARLREWLESDRAPDLQFVGTILDYIASNMVYFIYFLYAMIALLFVLLVVELARNLKQFSLPARRQGRGAKLQISGEPVWIDVSHLDGRDKLIGVFKNLLYRLEAEGHLINVESSTNRELAVQLESSDIQAVFKEIYPWIDRLVFTDIDLSLVPVEKIEDRIHSLAGSPL